ncbi:hypothetical protein ACM9XD_07765 [Xanthomonas sacchari]
MKPYPTTCSPASVIIYSSSEPSATAPSAMVEAKHRRFVGIKPPIGRRSRASSIDK